MGFTYRKSIRFGKFLRVNFSKRGPSVSVGPRGAKINIGADGKERITVSKGGMRYTKQVTLPHESHAPHSEASPQDQPLPATPHAATSPRQRTIAGAYFCFVLLGSHYLYLRKPLLQLLFWVTLGGFALWAIVDLFRIPKLVAEFNAH